VATTAVAVLHCGLLTLREAFLSARRRRYSVSPTLVAAAIAATLLAACDPASRTPDTASLGIDDFGDTIRPPALATRIVSLNPTTTEILFALGAGPRLVGRTHYDKYPDSARLVPDLGPGIRPNVEAVLAARPDLVLLYASSDNRAAAVTLRAAGIATVGFKVDRIEQFDAATRLLGRIIGDSARGALVADTVKRTLDSARALTAGLPRPTVVLPAWDSPLLVIGGGSFMTQLVEAAGGRNIYDTEASPSPGVAFEDIVRRDPDYVLVGPESAARLRRQGKWRALRAVREGRMLIIDTMVTLRPATRLGEGALSLVRLLHPGVLK